MKTDIKNSRLKWAGFAALLLEICAVCIVYYLRINLYDSHDYQVHIGSVSFYWQNVMNALLILTVVLLTVAAYFAPTRFRYLYVGLIIGYFIFSPHHSYLFDEIAGYEILTEVGIYDDME